VQLQMNEDGRDEGRRAARATARKLRVARPTSNPSEEGDAGVALLMS